MPEQKLTIPVGRAGALTSLLIGVLTLFGLVWGVASWATQMQADKAVHEALTSEGYASANELRNLRELLDARLSALEQRNARLEGQVEYLYHREIERSGGNLPAGAR